MQIFEARSTGYQPTEGTARPNKPPQGDTAAKKAIVADAEKMARLKDIEQSLREFSERINIPPLEVPRIAKMYLHNGETYECYDVHTEATYGNGMLTVTATYRRIKDDGETD